MRTTDTPNNWQYAAAWCQRRATCQVHTEKHVYRSMHTNARPSATPVSGCTHKSRHTATVHTLVKHLVSLPRAAKPEHSLCTAAVLAECASVWLNAAVHTLVRHQV